MTHAWRWDDLTNDRRCRHIPILPTTARLTHLAALDSML